MNEKRYYAYTSEFHHTDLKPIRYRMSFVGSFLTTYHIVSAGLGYDEFHTSEFHHTDLSDFGNYEIYPAIKF